MMDNSGDNWGERQQARSSVNWPLVVGTVVAVVVLLASVGVLAWKLGWLSNLGLFSKWPAPEVIELNPSTSSDGTVARQYEWKYERSSFSLNLQIPNDIYDYYSRMERAPVEDYSIYVTHPDDDAELVDPLAAELKRLAAQKGYDSEETVNFAASFVQNLRYRLEDEEYPNYPVETLYDRGGDCEDTAILTAALLQSMGYDTVLIRFDPEGERVAGHMAVGVAVAGFSGGYSYTFEGRKYYYLETTSASWTLGEIPSEYEGECDAIYEMVPAPALRFTGNMKYTTAYKTVEIAVTVTNWGTDDADGFYIRAYFEGRESGAKSSDTYDLAYGYRISGVVVDDIGKPSGGGTLQVELWLDGDVMDNWSVDVS